MCWWQALLLLSEGCRRYAPDQEFFERVSAASFCLCHPRPGFFRPSVTQTLLPLRKKKSQKKVERISGCSSTRLCSELSRLGLTQTAFSISALGTRRCRGQSSSDARARHRWKWRCDIWTTHFPSIIATQQALLNPFACTAPWSAMTTATTTVARVHPSIARAPVSIMPRLRIDPKHTSRPDDALVLPPLIAIHPRTVITAVLMIHT